MKRAHIFVSGIVQGINFRRFIKENADSLNINGVVRNLTDSRVEAIFEGKEDKIEKMIDICKKGSLFSRIENIKVVKEKYKGEFSSFEILR